jgi:hypothetical protein
MRLYSFLPAAIIFAALGAAGSLKTAVVSPESLIKGSLPAVYYLAVDGKRYVFPNDKIYFSWYQDFSAVKIVTDAELASYTIGGNVTYKPATRLVKIQSDPKVYAVGSGGTFRWLKTEAAAVALFGSDWAKQVDDISDSFFVDYKLGADISSASDFNRAAESSVLSIGKDKKLAVLPPTEPEPVLPAPEPEKSCAVSCVLGSACVQGICKEVPGPSNIKLRAFVIDTLSTCFVGDACVDGDCCNVGGTSFAKNANLKTVRPIDKYLYADKQQLCGKAIVTAADRNRFTNAMDSMANAIGAAAPGRVNLSWDSVRLSGDMTVSRIPGSCDWWVAPADIAERTKGSIDSQVDASVVFSSRNFDIGNIQMPDDKTVGQDAGLGGAGYGFVAKEWETDTSGAPSYAKYMSVLTEQMRLSLEKGISDPNKSLTGNHCRDGKKNIDETGLDCGGVSCVACSL